MSGLSTVQLLVFFSLPIVSSLEGSHYEQPVLEEWGVILHLLKAQNLHRSFQSTSAQEICLFSHIDLFIVQLHQYGLLYIYYKHLDFYNNLGRVLMASSGQRPGMLVLYYTRQTSTTKSCLTPNIYSAMVKKPHFRVLDVLSCQRLHMEIQV